MKKESLIYLNIFVVALLFIGAGLPMLRALPQLINDGYGGIVLIPIVTLIIWFVVVSFSLVIYRWRWLKRDAPNGEKQISIVDISAPIIICSLVSGFTYGSQPSPDSPCQSCCLESADGKVITSR
jgi:amino acid transporter